MRRSGDGGREQLCVHFVINWEDDLSAKGFLPDFEAGCLLVGLATLEQGCWTSAVGTTKQTYPELFVGTCRDCSHEVAWLLSL